MSFSHLVDSIILARPAVMQPSTSQATSQASTHKLDLSRRAACAGYDVWFGNVRGNIFSRNHTSLQLLDPKFWAFSWDEMAARDLPAMLTYALLASGASEVAYVGHSQGTTLGLAFLASHAGSELAARVKVRRRQSVRQAGSSANHRKP